MRIKEELWTRLDEVVAQIAVFLHEKKYTIRELLSLFRKREMSESLIRIKDTKEYEFAKMIDLLLDVK